METASKSVWQASGCRADKRRNFPLHPSSALTLLPPFNPPTNWLVIMVRTLCSHWWRSHWFPGLPEAEAGVALSAGRGGERRTDTGCLACRPRSTSAGRRRSSTRTWWPPARASAAGPGRGRTHAQRPGEGPCLQGRGRRWATAAGVDGGLAFVWKQEQIFASSSSPSSVSALADLFNFPTKRVRAELERRLWWRWLSQPHTHPCGFRGSMTHRSRSGCPPAGAFLGRRRERGSHPGRQRGGCLRASTCRCRIKHTLKPLWSNNGGKQAETPFKHTHTHRRPAARWQSWAGSFLAYARLKKCSCLWTYEVSRCSF